MTYLAAGHRLLVGVPRVRLNPAVAYRTQPDLLFRLLGYGGLALLATLHLRTMPGMAAAGLLGFSLLWPILWWWAVAGQPALRSPDHRWSPAAHAVECLLVLSLVALTGVDPGFLGVVSLLCLTGVTALGGMRLLAPCATTVGLALLVFGGWGQQRVLPEPNMLLIWLLLASCLLGLAWQSYGQVRRQHARRQFAQSESARLRNSNDRMARYLPDGLMPMISTAPEALRQPRERFVTVAFVDVVGFVDLVAAHGVAEVRDVMNDFMTTVTRITGRHDGVIGKFLGDGVLVYFSESDQEPDGAASRIAGTEKAATTTTTTTTTTRADAAMGAARMALTLGPAMVTLGRAWRERGLTVHLQTRVGLASGYCALGDWGGQARLDYTLIGTAVNLASRLQAAASPGGVLISSATAALIARDESLCPRLTGPRPLAVKGFGEVMVHELSGSAKVRAIHMPVKTGTPDT